ncbi:MAG: hypothetical protein ACU0BF_12155 [Paracoccaceae bacterium]
MTREDAIRDEYELQLVNARVPFVLEQSRTEFWQVGIAAVVGGAVMGGFVVQILNAMGT